MIRSALYLHCRYNKTLECVVVFDKFVYMTISSIMSKYTILSKWINNIRTLIYIIGQNKK